MTRQSHGVFIRRPFQRYFRCSAPGCKQVTRNLREQMSHAGLVRQAGDGMFQ